MSAEVACSNMLYLQHGDADLKREPRVDRDDAKLLGPFRILASLLQEVKQMFQEQRTLEIESLYQLFAAYGGPVTIVLDLALQENDRCSKVYQSLRKIANQKMKLLRSQMSKSVHAGVPPDIGHGSNYPELDHWDNLCDSSDEDTAQTLHDQFDGLVYALLYPTSSLNDLELAVRRLRMFLTFELGNKRPSLESATTVLTRELSHCSLGNSSVGNESTGTRVSADSVSGTPQVQARSSHSFEDTLTADEEARVRDERSMANIAALDMSHDDLTHTRSSLSSTYTSSHSSSNGLEHFGASTSSVPNSYSVVHAHGPYGGDLSKGGYRIQQLHQSQPQRSMLAHEWGANDDFDDLGDADGFAQHVDDNWLSKTELPRRPFKSRECDFFKQGKCSKEVCNFAHGNKEKDWWTALYQGMIPCKTPGCLGRANGCLSAHSPDEQLTSKFRYEDTVNNVTIQSGRGERMGSGWSNGGVGMSTQVNNGPNSQYGVHRNTYNAQPNDASAASLMSDLGSASSGVAGMQDQGHRLTTPAGAFGWNDSHASSNHDSHNWLGKNDLPRPFRSKKCDFFASSGLCIKPVCNYAHDKTEMLFWSDLFQTMFRCNNKGCTGKGATIDRGKYGCTFSHSPEEQLSNMQAYETAVANAKVYSRQPPGASGGNGPSAKSDGSGTSGHTQNELHQNKTRALGAREGSEQTPRPSGTMGGQGMWKNASAGTHPQHLQHYAQQSPFNLIGTTVSLEERLNSSGGEVAYGVGGLGHVASKSGVPGGGGYRSDANSAPCRPQYNLSSEHAGIKDTYKADGMGYGMRW